MITYTNAEERGCGYRADGALYIMAGMPATTCGLLPLLLEVCPTCHGGIKQARGWTWIEPGPLFLASDNVCPSAKFSSPYCGVCVINKGNAVVAAALGLKAGLLWVGTAHYPTPGDFIKEGLKVGLSKRISALPKKFVIGQTRIFFAHPKAIDGDKPGIFGSMIATGVDYIVKDEEERMHDLWDGAEDKDLMGRAKKIVMKLRRMEAKGIRLVRVNRVGEQIEIGLPEEEEGRNPALGTSEYFTEQEKLNHEAEV